MASDTDALSHFVSLDELIQVIYQGSSRFVVLSAVDEVGWIVHVGLSGDEGRWWRGRWTDKDIRRAAGANFSSDALEIFADALTNAFVQGEMYIGNWSSKKGTEINLVLGTNLSAPAHVSLVELASEEAAAFATQIFTNIAIQAQSRKCHLHPSPFESSSANSSVPPKSTASRTATVSSKSISSDQIAEEEIKELKAELAKARSAQASYANLSGDRHQRNADDGTAHTFTPPTAKTSQKLKKDASIQDSSKLVSIAKTNRGSSAAMTHRGASLANPTKKARKYEALEFGSDED